MNNAMDTFNTQQLALSLNTDNSNSSEIIHREKIENTPFELVGNKDDGYFVAFGKFRVSNRYKIDKQEYEDDVIYQRLGLQILYKEQWSIITNLMVLFKDFAEEQVFKKLSTVPEKNGE